MTRCTPRLISALFVLAALVPLATLPTKAQSPEFKPVVRPFPPAALRGEMVVLAPPAITLDGKAERLSPGARIRGANNLVVMSGALVNQTLAVNYLRESAGQVHEVWILNSEEAKLKRPNSKSSWFSFGSGTDAVSPATGKAP
jgi:hypothetical protein